MQPGKLARMMVCEVKLKKGGGAGLLKNSSRGPLSALEQVIVDTVSSGHVKAMALLLQRQIKAVREEGPQERVCKAGVHTLHKDQILYM